ncbi:hypothetical protein [Pediococcus pentosaceus]|uniref:hypothetical protein n=1 Tax=Pediococcus pentosaceus TaxID=1255 RepID=UPI0039822F5F
MLKRMWEEIKRRPAHWFFTLISCELGIFIGAWLASLMLGEVLNMAVLLPGVFVMPIAVAINLARYVTKNKDKR